MRPTSATNIHLNFWCMNVHNLPMDNDELKSNPQPEAQEVDADGYFGEGDTGTEDLDLSFLDEDDEEAKPAKPEA
jgi:hypothetical protein